MNKLALLFTACLSLLVACNNDDVDQQEECPDNIACTEQYVTLTVSFSDNNGDPLVLDSYTVTLVATGEVLTFSSNIDPVQGTYALAEDKHLELVEKNGSELRFEGIVDGSKVVDEIFLVGHDCCHVVLIEEE